MRMASAEAATQAMSVEELFQPFSARKRSAEIVGETEDLLQADGKETPQERKQKQAK